MKHQDLELPWSASRRRQVASPSRGSICRNRQLLAIRVLPHGERMIIRWIGNRVIPVIQQI